MVEACVLVAAVAAVLSGRLLVAVRAAPVGPLRSLRLVLVGLLVAVAGVAAGVVGLVLVVEGWR